MFHIANSATCPLNFVARRWCAIERYGYLIFSCVLEKASRPMGNQENKLTAFMCTMYLRTLKLRRGKVERPVSRPQRVGILPLPWPGCWCCTQPYPVKMQSLHMTPRALRFLNTVIPYRYSYYGELYLCSALLSPQTLRENTFSPFLVLIFLYSMVWWVQEYSSRQNF